VQGYEQHHIEYPAEHTAQSVQGGLTGQFLQKRHIRYLSGGEVLSFPEKKQAPVLITGACE
jgi:hypothetical protein